MSWDEPGVAPGRYTIHVSSWLERIPVANDRELTAALARVERHFSGAAAARIVHDLALKGAEALELERGERGAAAGRVATPQGGSRPREPVSDPAQDLSGS